MLFSKDDKIVMTLDAGGTNFVFTAIQAKEKIVDEITLPSYGNMCVCAAYESQDAIEPADDAQAASRHNCPCPVWLTIPAIA